MTLFTNIVINKPQSENWNEIKLTNSVIVDIQID